MSKSLTIVLLTLSLTLPAVAQQRAGGSGHAHDAKQQVGSGGTNRAAPQVDYRLRNNLITGNVAGGSGFRGPIPYRAPSEFRGALGSDALFNFRARSFYSAPSQLNNATARNVNLATPGSIGGASVYRSYTNLAGQTLGSSRSTTPYNEGGSSGSFVQGTSIARGNTFTQVTQREQTGLPGAGLGILRTTDGQRLNIIDSPLLGIRQLNIPRPQRRDENSPETQQKLDEQNRALSKNARIDRQMYQADPNKPDEEPAATDDAPHTDVPRIAAPTMMLGRELQSFGVTDDQRQSSPDAQQRTKMLRESIFNPQESDRSSVYGSLLRDVREGSQAAETPQWKATIEVQHPDTPRIELVEQAALQAIRRAYGLNLESDGEPAEDDGGLDDAFTTTDESVATILKQLNYDLPTLSTLAGNQATRANEFMKRAEAEMLVDDFFKAESSYRQALLLTPNDPMAQVGLAHAQLGAGMIRSCALNLRRLFEAYPQLIATRYEARLLPNEQRLRWVQGELNKLAENPNSSTDPGIVTAYLGYQISSRQLVRYGLALAQARSPRDPLLPVLRQIWLDEQQAATQPRETAPADISPK